jgi:hypothetical protein
MLSLTQCSCRHGKKHSKKARCEHGRESEAADLACPRRELGAWPIRGARECGAPVAMAESAEKIKCAIQPATTQLEALLTESGANGTSVEYAPTHRPT